MIFLVRVFIINPEQEGVLSLSLKRTTTKIGPHHKTGSTYSNGKRGKAEKTSRKGIIPRKNKRGKIKKYAEIKNIRYNLNKTLRKELS
jgi:hypothetical protein